MGACLSCLPAQPIDDSDDGEIVRRDNTYYPEKAPRIESAACSPSLPFLWSIDHQTALFFALEELGLKLAARGAVINIVTVGGSVNTLVLRTNRPKSSSATTTGTTMTTAATATTETSARETPVENGDFYHAVDSLPELHEITAAAQLAHEYASAAADDDTRGHRKSGGIRSQVSGDDGDSEAAERCPTWINDATQPLLLMEMQREFSKAAMKRDNIVFQRIIEKTGLRIFAVSWLYVLCSQMCRLQLPTTTRRPYDLADTVMLVEQHLRTTGATRISTREIDQTCRKHNMRVQRSMLDEVDALYLIKHGMRVFLWAGRMEDE